VARSLIWSGVALAVHFALFIGSLSYTTVASSVTLATMSPIFVGLGATWFLREPPSRRTWIGMAVTVVGAVTIGVGDASGLELGARALLGDAMALASAVAVTAYLLIGRAVRPQVPIAVYGTVVYGVAASMLVVAALASGAALTGYEGATWLALLGLVVGPQLLGHTVFNTLLSRVTATVIAIVVLAEPVGATILALVLLDESPAPLFWVGAPLILAGVAIATVSGRRRPATAPL
jgi:drug/metabolite transporter (DMT)-like permease